MVFGASKTPLNNRGVDLDDPMVPMPKDGAHRDGQIPQFYVKWQNLTVPMCSILRHGHYRIVQIDPRVVQGPFRGSEKQHTSHTDLPSGKIGHHMGQNDALAYAWGTLLMGPRKMVPSPRHGELYSEMVLWPWPGHGLAGSGVKSAP